MTYERQTVTACNAPVRRESALTRSGCASRTQPRSKASPDRRAPRALDARFREELISRNVARLSELPAWEPREVRSWSADEALAFLRAAKPDPLYPSFVFLLVYGDAAR
jgi:hypothetical protein